MKSQKEIPGDLRAIKIMANEVIQATSDDNVSRLATLIIELCDYLAENQAEEVGIGG